MMFGIIQDHTYIDEDIIIIVYDLFDVKCE